MDARHEPARRALIGSKMERLTPANALARLAQTDAPFVTLLAHNDVEVEIYRPHKVDAQTPHARDELYIVIAGSGWFVNGDTRHRFEPGEVLFVAAGVEHRFERFSDDFSTWVVFFGAPSGR